MDAVKRLRYVTVNIPSPTTGKWKKYRIDIRKEFSLSDKRMRFIVRDHAQQVFFWSHVKHRIIAELRTAEAAHQKQYDAYYLAYRFRLKKEDNYIPDAVVRIEAESHDEVIELKDKVNALKAKLGSITAICEALDHRRSMIVQMANNRG